MGLSVLIEPGLAETLNRITVSADGLSASLDGKRVEAENRRDLRAQLALRLYRELHSGAGPPPEHSTLMPRAARDPSFEAEIREAVPHRYTRAWGLLLDVDGVGSRTELVVQLPEITASVPITRFAGDAIPKPGDMVEVLLDAFRQNVSPGFYYVMGSRLLGADGTQIRRLFIHVANSRSVPAIWRAVLCQLESAELCYHTKILSDRGAYPRRDALVVYLKDAPAGMEQAIADSVVGHPGLAPDISVFTEKFAAGVGGADDPIDARPGYAGMSFGQHRSMALATALTQHAVASHLASRDEVIAQVFREALIDPLRPARNLQKDMADV